VEGVLVAERSEAQIDRLRLARLRRGAVRLKAQTLPM
jgi:hypothetical protein